MQRCSLQHTWENFCKARSVPPSTSFSRATDSMRRRGYARPMQYNDVPDLRYSDEAQAISGRFGQQMRRTTTPAYPKVSHFCPKGKA